MLKYLIAAPSISGDLQKFSSGTIEILNGVLGGLVGLMSVIFTIMIIAEIVKMRSSDPAKADAAKASLKKSVGVLIGILIVAGIGFGLINGVLVKAVESFNPTAAIMYTDII